MMIGFLAGGCTPIPATWQQPVAIVGILVGLLSIVFSAQVSAASRGRTSRPLAIILGAVFVVIGTLAFFGAIQFARHCSPS